MNIRRYFMYLLVCTLLLNSMANTKFLAIGQLRAQGIDIPILPLKVWESYPSEKEALAKGQDGSTEEIRKAAVTLFLLSRKESDSSKSFQLLSKASAFINRIYRRKRNDLLLGLLSGEINIAAAEKASRLQDKISYSNRGLANYEFVLPNIPNNLEAKEIYLRTTVYIPTYFKNLSKEQLQQIKLFLDGYDTAMKKLTTPEDRDRLEELKTHVMIIAAKISSRSGKTRGDVKTYLSQVDPEFFPIMRLQGNGDLVDMYDDIKK